MQLRAGTARAGKTKAAREAGARANLWCHKAPAEAMITVRAAAADGVPASTKDCLCVGRESPGLFLPSRFVFRSTPLAGGLGVVSATFEFGALPPR